MMTTYANGSTTAFYKITVNLGQISSYNLTSMMILDEYGCLANCQIPLIISMVQALKGWNESPSIFVNDEAREIRLEF
jgi:hypothetical protein